MRQLSCWFMGAGCLLLLLLALSINANANTVDLSLYVERALTFEEVPPGSFEPQYASENQLEAIKQERLQQQQEDAHPKVDADSQAQQQQPQEPEPEAQSTAPSSSSPSSKFFTPEMQDAPSQHPVDGSNTAFLMEDVVIHDATTQTQKQKQMVPALIELTPLTPAEEMYGPYVAAQNARRFGSRFLQVRGPSSSSAGAPAPEMSSYATMIGDTYEASFGNPRGGLGTYRPLVNLYSDGTPYPLDMRKFDHFPAAPRGSTSTS